MPVSKIIPAARRTPCSASLQVLVPRQGMLPREDAALVTSLNWKLRLPSATLGSSGKEGGCCMRVVDPDYRKEIGLLLQNGDKEELTLSTKDPLENLLVLPVVKVSGKNTTAQCMQDYKLPRPFMNKIWVTLPGKEP